MEPSQVELGSHILNESVCGAWNILCFRSISGHLVLIYYVSPEITISSEDFVALVALVGFVVGVGEQVSLQVGTLVEAALAHRALVRRLL